MSNIKIDNFTSSNSRKDARKLANECAVYLKNCNLVQSYLEPFSNLKLIDSHNLDNVKTIYRYYPDVSDSEYSELLIYNKATSIVQTPKIFDNFKRFYYTNEDSNVLMQRTNEAISTVSLPAPSGVNYQEIRPGISKSMLTAKAYLGTFGDSYYDNLTVKSLSRNGDIYTAVLGFDGFSVLCSGNLIKFDEIPIRIHIAGLGYLPIIYDDKGNSDIRYNIVGYNNEVCAEIYLKDVIYGEKDTSWYHNPTNNVVYYPHDITAVFKIEYGETEDIITNYCQTFVNKYGDEGPRSEFSGAILHKFGSKIKITNLNIPESHVDVISKRRIYRSDKTCQNEDLKLIAELDPSVTSFTDYDHELDEQFTVALNENSNPPENIQGITPAPNGMIAGFVDNKVYVTRAHAALAWSDKYKIELGHRIIALRAIKESLLAITDGAVYAIDYSDLEEIKITNLNCYEQCVNAESVVANQEKVYYVSKSGIIAVSASGYENLTQDIVDKHEWQEFLLNINNTPAEIHCFIHDGNLFIGKRDSDRTKLFNLEKKYLLELTFGVDAFCYDSYADKLLIAKGSDIYEWNDESSPLEYCFKTKKFTYQDPVTWSWLKVTFGGDEPQNSTAEIKLYTDEAIQIDEPILSFNVAGNRPFRLPLIKEGYDWQFEIISTDVVLDFSLANSYDELI
ncbi:hypothetical protein AAEX28_12965 [Lentisphaerota bacterium WC36G]|nr:hypothetical protein LJT99_15785 [Lentisphaerae bacterium WC36]